MVGERGLTALASWGPRVALVLADRCPYMAMGTLQARAGWSTCHSSLARPRPALKSQPPFSRAAAYDFPPHFISLKFFKTMPLSILAAVADP